MLLTRCFPLLLLLLLSACAGNRSTAFSTTSDPLTRLVQGSPDSILAAAASALRAMGFEIVNPTSGAVRIYSQPVVVQSMWRGSPIADRLRCGIGTAAPSDPNRVVELTNMIPIELSLGYEVEPRPGSTATRLLFNAQGRRSGGDLLTAPTMACTVTVPFVQELFTELEAELTNLR